eukprot:comp21080_c0_seq1/m.28408 comp21080_c0_seq1/g.28408  ORF comp21080_c0_seq1/g.28408 comp21080_c0_seq1/m.28408 type:complete len:126 (-) comp21080_c0_seq1:490-867(-)
MADTSATAPDTNAHTAAIAAGLLSVLLPVAQELDERSTAVGESQVLLATEIDRLTAELEKFLANNRLPGSYEAQLRKLVVMRQRITAVNSTLSTIQQRVDKMVTAIDKENKRQKRIQTGTTSFFG